MSGLTRRELFTLRRRRASAPPRAGWVQRLDAPPATPTPAPAAPMPAPAARRRLLPLHRPPGALPEAAFLETCSRCPDCIAACPHGALRPGAARLGAAAGTPVIEAGEAPCRLCADRPCAAACPTGAIAREGDPRMGSARVLDHACLAAQGLGCSVCREQCPVPGAVRWEGGRPRIDAARCVGCGVCLHVCPAPQNAILLVPRLPQGAA
ncbi:MAG: 4Fe-4S dicluster domain-containing protein [Planctomycetota bacterium]